MKSYYVNRAEVDKAYKKGLKDGISRGANGSLNQIINLGMQVLEETYGWSEEQIVDFKAQMIEKVKSLNEIVVSETENQ